MIGVGKKPYAVQDTKKTKASKNAPKPGDLG